MGKIPMAAFIHLSKRDNSLLPGTVPEDIFWGLVEVSAIRSDKIIKALKDYFVDGKSRKVICLDHDVNNGYLSTSIARMEKAHLLIKQMAYLYRTSNM
ncbi:transcriptional regulator [Salmonella enterica subsp. enterica serovar Bareilly]|nr:transcriptional regulator [Salmonella enterica subsp. enterica serovar Bareilly]